MPGTDLGNEAALLRGDGVGVVTQSGQDLSAEVPIDRVRCKGVTGVS